MTNNIILYKDIETLKQAVEKVAPLAEEYVVLGFAEDHNPVYFDITNAKTPNLIIWDKIVGQGLLVIKTAIDYILRFRRGSEIEFIIVSNNMREWKNLCGRGFGVWSQKECIAILPFSEENLLKQVFYGLALWCYEKRNPKHPTMVFIDGIENLQGLDVETKENIRYILEYGRAKGVYVVGTADSQKRDTLYNWIESFQGEISGLQNIRWFEAREKGRFFNFFAPITGI